MDNNLKKIKWTAQWIANPEARLDFSQKKVSAAPFFRKEFTWKRTVNKVFTKICGLGFYELYINGHKLGDHVLDPVVTHYDKHINYVVYDITEHLIDGVNTIVVVLGNGWYNCHTPNVWQFEEITWRDSPKLLLQLVENGKTLLISDTSWKVTSGPITFDALRGGETYDARLELEDCLSPKYDDSFWKDAVPAIPPKGILQEQLMPSCKVMETLSTKNKWDVPNGTVYDIGENITGWSRITVSGENGAQLTIRYGERLHVDGTLDQDHIGKYLKEGNCQTDRYILKGDCLEIWEPRFTYHGFQYIQIEINGEAQIKKVEGRVVNTSFEKIGSFSCSDKNLNRLQECTLRSYIGNFTGIPTDCPHREKNGWTGDAHLAAETGLYNFDVSSAYCQWIDTLVDFQRSNGQVPVMVPSTDWGYKRNGGPAWDSALLLIPWYIYLFTGDLSIINKHYEAMKRYINFCTSMAENNIVEFTLGDWCHVDSNRIVSTALTSTAYYFTDCRLLASFAELLGHYDDKEVYSSLASEIKKSFNITFYTRNGIYAKGEQTAMGTALYHNLVENKNKDKVLKCLINAVKANDCKADFGILGAKYIPRVLADNGYMELAYKLITQPKYPGWVNWLNQGATTLWENWNGNDSLNHIMFGDISAWMYKYIAGISPDPEETGFKHFFIHPHPVKSISWAKGEYALPSGKIVSSWKYKNDLFILDVEIPPETNATVILPGGENIQVRAGLHHFIDK